jgi:hypothetical protein
VNPDPAELDNCSISPDRLNDDVARYDLADSTA